MLRRTCTDWVVTSKPLTVAVPAVGFNRVVSIRRVVVLPAPFGPRNETISPSATSRSTPLTACTSTFSRPCRVWNVWTSPRAVINGRPLVWVLVGSSLVGSSPSWVGASGQASTTPVARGGDRQPRRNSSGTVGADVG